MRNGLLVTLQGADHKHVWGGKCIHAIRLTILSMPLFRPTNCSVMLTLFRPKTENGGDYECVYLLLVPCWCEYTVCMIVCSLQTVCVTSP